MKRLILKLSLVVALILSCGVAKANEKNVDPKLMPTQVKEFMDTYFHHSKVILAEYEKGVYELKLSDGYEVKINEYGQWEKIEAPDNQVIPVALQKKFLPRKTVDYLNSQNCGNIVEEISFNFETGFKIDLSNKNDLRFTKSGILK